MSTGLRAFGDLRLSYDLRAAETLMLKADATDAAAYVDFDNGSAITAFWITAGIEVSQTALDFWDGEEDQANIVIPVSAALAQIDPAGILGTGTGCEWTPADITVPVTASTLHTLEYYRNGSNIEIFVDTVSIRTATTGAAIQIFRFGDRGANGAGSVVYLASIKVGTTQGGTDIFEWNGTDLSQFTVTGAVTVEASPF